MPKMYRTPMMECINGGNVHTLTRFDGFNNEERDIILDNEPDWVCEDCGMKAWVGDKRTFRRTIDSSDKDPRTDNATSIGDFETGEVLD